MSINSVTISGNLVRDPEVRTTASGSNWITFTIAANERKKNGEVWEDVPSYIDCKAFDRVANYMVRCDVAKGSKVAVHGRLVQERWQDKDGGNRSALRVLVDDVEPMNGRVRAAAETVEAAYEEIPF